MRRLLFLAGVRMSRGKTGITDCTNDSAGLRCAVWSLSGSDRRRAAALRTGGLAGGAAGHEKAYPSVRPSRGSGGGAAQMHHRAEILRRRLPQPGQSGLYRPATGLSAFRNRRKLLQLGLLPAVQAPRSDAGQAVRLQFAAGAALSRYSASAGARFHAQWRSAGDAAQRTERSAAAAAVGGFDARYSLHHSGAATRLQRTAAGGGNLPGRQRAVLPQQSRLAGGQAAPGRRRLSVLAAYPPQRIGRAVCRYLPDR